MILICFHHQDTEPGYSLLGYPAAGGYEVTGMDDIKRLEFYKVIFLFISPGECEASEAYLHSVRLQQVARPAPEHRRPGNCTSINTAFEELRYGEARKSETPYELLRYGLCLT